MSVRVANYGRFGGGGQIAHHPEEIVSQNSSKNKYSFAIIFWRNSWVFHAFGSCNAPSAIINDINSQVFSNKKYKHENENYLHRIVL